MAIKDIKNIDKLKSMLKSLQEELKYVKQCCKEAGLELAKNSYPYDYKEKNLVVQSMAVNNKLKTKEQEIEILKTQNIALQTMEFDENKKLKTQLMEKSEVDMFFSTPIEGWDNDPCKICQYKQDYKQKEQECEKLKAKLNPKLRNAHCVYFEGQTGLCKAKEFTRCNPVNCKLYTIDELSTIVDLQNRNTKLEQECEELRKQYNCNACGTCNGKEDYKNMQKHCEKAIAQNHKYKQELKPFKDPYFKGLDNQIIAGLAKKSIRLSTENRKLENALDEISKILDSGTADTQTNNAKWLHEYYLSRFCEIGDIISKAKEQ